jgi:ABC-type nitrate/sulfonate/bicarbonate transport system substrate-binding protein
MNPSKTIRGLAFVAACSLVLSQGGTAASAAEPAKLRIGVVRAAGTLPLQHAVDSGALAKDGVAVEIIQLNNGPAISSALISGAIDVGFAATMAVITARANSQPIKMFVPVTIETGKQSSNWVDATEGRGLTSIKDLAGKTLAMNAVGGMCELLLRAHMAQAGMPEGSVKTIILPFPQIPAAIQLKNADAGCAIEPFHSILETNPQIKGKPIVFGAFPGLGDQERVLIDGFFARDAWLQDNPAVAAKFAHAIVMANKQVMEDPALMSSLFVKHLKVDPAVAAKIKVLLETDNVAIPSSEIMPTLDLMKKVGLLNASIEPKDVVAQVK